MLIFITLNYEESDGNNILNNWGTKEWDFVERNYLKNRAMIDAWHWQGFDVNEL